MKMRFDNAAGEILDLLWSLYYGANYDYVMSEVKKNDITPDENIEKISQNLMNNEKINRGTVQFFFDREAGIFDLLFDKSDIFGKTLEELLLYIEKMPEDEVIKRLVKELLRDRIINEEELNVEVERVIQKNELFYFIKNLGISDGSKWNLLCFVRETSNYLKQAVELIRKYAPVYFKELKKYRKRLDEFNTETEKRLNENGEVFLKQLLKRNFKSEEYEEIYITTTYLHYYSLYFYSAGNKGYVILGINFESIMNKIEGSSEIDKNLTVFKNISDRTRFEIIKLLLKKDYFGQEIAEALNITTATVSYHMNYLFGSNLIEISRKEHKAYYMLNKETIRKSIGFLNRELDL